MTSPGRPKRTIGSVMALSVRRGPVRAGMTLIEIMLALALLVMLATLVAVGVGQGHERHRFNDAANRFETLIRIARAAAQTTGCPP